jgi:hypothetical protein
VVQEGRGLEIEDEQVAEAAYVGTRMIFTGEIGLALGCPKGGKVLLAEQQVAAACIAARSSG